MNTLRDHETVIAAWLDDGPQTLPDETRHAIAVGIRTVTRRPAGIGWRFTRPGLPTIDLRRLSLTLGGTAVVVAVVGALALNYVFNQQGGFGGRSTGDSEVTQLLNGFIEARIAGEGAQQYLGDSEQGIPLLYATTSGAHYERAEFEPVPGIEWPYGDTAFKVRLFAGNTVVEQLLFVDADRPPKLSYEPDGFGTDIAPTTEDGQPLALPYDAFDGGVTLRVAHPWVFYDYRQFGGMTFGRLIPEGPGVLPTTDGGQRGDWDELFVIADPALLGTDCQAGPDPADAAALAESIRSDLDLGATAPVAVSVGGTDALMMDVKVAAEATICVPATSVGDPLRNAVLEPLFTYEPGATFTFVDERATKGPASGEWMRLYLFDVPEGSSMRILALAIVAPESRFESTVEAAAPVLESLEFHAP